MAPYTYMYKVFLLMGVSFPSYPACKFLAMLQCKLFLMSEAYTSRKLEGSFSPLYLEKSLQGLILL